MGASGMDIGNMVSKLHGGLRCARAGWNGKGMYLFLVKQWQFTNLGEDCPCSPFIAMKTADDKVVPWLASQTDILATDWETVD
jgi:hypothetical protein